jgi:hypothetical protein
MLLRPGPPVDLGRRLSRAVMKPGRYANQYQSWTQSRPNDVWIQWCAVGLETQLPYVLCIELQSAYVSTLNHLKDFTYA